MKIKSPMVTLLAGVLVALVTLILSVRANDSKGSTPSPYGASVLAVLAVLAVLR
jgi:hypothetical protein